MRIYGNFEGFPLMTPVRVYLSGETSNIFSFTPILGEMIQFDEPMFQLGWNHQQVIYPLVQDSY